ncbi:MAG: hypothetical protein IPP56_13590 [Bacteroidetes bacterium]|nr:hypothetical protein [Bacteroidota bacterium]
MKKKGVKSKRELQSGLKPEGFFANDVVGTVKTLSDGVQMAWFVELLVDGKCIFREAYVPRETEELEIVEAFLISRVLRHIFTFGVMTSKRFIDKQLSNRTKSLFPLLHIP